MRLAIWCAIAVVILSSAVCHAHEIGTTRVTAVFQKSTSYEIEVVTDAAALVEKLETLSGEPVQSGLNAAALQAQLQAHDELFRRRFALTFDGTAAQPKMHYGHGNCDCDGGAGGHNHDGGWPSGRSKAIRVDLLMDVRNLFADGARDRR